MIGLPQSCHRNLQGVASALAIFALPLASFPALAGPQTPPASGFVLTAGTFAGRPMVVSSSKGDVLVRFAQGGAITGSTQGHDDTGKWWITGQKLCLQWQNWLDSKPHCFTVQPETGPVMRWRADGSGEEGIAYFTDTATAQR
jgi:hypothetical protein